MTEYSDGLNMNAVTEYSDGLNMNAVTEYSDGLNMNAGDGIFGWLEHKGHKLKWTDAKLRKH